MAQNTQDTRSISHVGRVFEWSCEAVTRCPEDRDTMALLLRSGKMLFKITKNDPERDYGALSSAFSHLARCVNEHPDPPTALKRLFVRFGEAILQHARRLLKCGHFDQGLAQLEMLFFAFAKAKLNVKPVWNSLVAAYTLADHVDEETLLKALEVMRGATPGRSIPSEPRLYLTLGKYEQAFASLRRRKPSDTALLISIPGVHVASGFADLEREDVTEVLVILEGGPGDELRLASTLNDYLIRTSARIHVACDPRLQPLLARSFPQIHVVPNPVAQTTHARRAQRNQSEPAIEKVLELAKTVDRVAFALDMLYDLRREISSFEGKRDPYLVPDPQRREVWRASLQALGRGPYVGINWRSVLRGFPRDKSYTRLADWGEILKTPNVTFICLQYDECKDEIEFARKTFGVDIMRFSELDMFDDLDGLAALISELDYVAAAPTNISEISGGLGVHTWSLITNRRNSWRINPLDGRDIWHRSVVSIMGDASCDTRGLLDNLSRSLRLEIEKSREAASNLQ